MAVLNRLERCACMPNNNPPRIPSGTEITIDESVTIALSHCPKTARYKKQHPTKMDKFRPPAFQPINMTMPMTPIHGIRGNNIIAPLPCPCRNPLDRRLLANQYGCSIIQEKNRVNSRNVNSPKSSPFINHFMKSLIKKRSGHVHARGYLNAQGMLSFSKKQTTVNANAPAHKAHQLTIHGLVFWLLSDWLFKIINPVQPELRAPHREKSALQFYHCQRQNMVRCCGRAVLPAFLFLY